MLDIEQKKEVENMIRSFLSSNIVFKKTGDTPLEAYDLINLKYFNANKNTISSGSVFMFGGTTAPSGYLECDGSAVSRTTYSALFTAIGTTWGAGNGSTTFNLPNMSRNVPVGRGGSGTGTLGSTVGSTGGEETHTLVSNEMPAHTHNTTVQFYSAGSFATGPAWNGDTNQAGHTQVDASTSTGGGGAHNNIQPSAVFMFIIKT